METEGDGSWPYGLRPEADLTGAFKEELQDITVNAPCEPNPDGSVPLGDSDKVLLRWELVSLMKRAHKGSVRQIEFEEVRSRDVVVEFKYPRPGDLGGWHYRMYTGVPKHPDSTYLVWLGAGRKPDSEFDPDGWSELQTGQINASHDRFRGWLLSRYAARA